MPHVAATIGYCAQLCAEGGTVIWTRARWAPDLVPQICAWFEQRGFEQTWLSPADHNQCTGAHRRIAPPDPLDPDAVMFAFTNHNPNRPRPLLATDAPRATASPARASRSTSYDRQSGSHRRPIARWLSRCRLARRRQPTASAASFFTSDHFIFYRF